MSTINEDLLSGKRTYDNADEYAELLRLARLGLWAKEHGIPAMKEASYQKQRTYGSQIGNGPIFVVLVLIEDALAALRAVGVEVEGWVT